MTDIYFAAQSTDELLKSLKQKIELWKRWTVSSGLQRKWSKSYDLYYGRHVAGGDNTEIQIVGEDGELTAIGVNHYRNLIKHALALTCGQKPSFDSKATNNDLESKQQARIANSVLDYYLTEKRLFRHYKQVTEYALVFKSAFLYEPWEPSLGNPYTTENVLNENNEQLLDENGEPVTKIIYEGDVNPSALPPWRVIFDPYLKSWNKCKWIIVVEFENKYDLATRYPELRDRILSANDRSNNHLYEDILDKSFFDESITGDDIPVFNFYHLPSDTLKNGRYTKLLSDDLCLYDGAYPYRKKLPVVRMTPSEVVDSVEGYSDFEDLMVLQSAINILYSTFFTNQQAFGVQALWMPDGVNVSETALGPLRLLKGGPPGSEPKAIQLTATPPEIFKGIEFFQSGMELLSGINSVVRGDPEQSLKSGVALGRLQAMAIQFSSNLQQSWAELLEDGGTFLLNLLQDFAKTERMYSIVGKVNRSIMGTFTGDKIKDIERVTVVLGNPLSRTPSGRIELADLYLEKGFCKNADEYTEVMETGNLESMLVGPRARAELISLENEALMNGEQAKAMIGDKHLTHIDEHLAIIANPDIRKAELMGDPLARQIVANVTMHIQEHIDLHNTQDPIFSMIAGEPPPMPMPGMAPMPMEGQPNPQSPANENNQAGLVPPQQQTDLGIAPQTEGIL